MEIEHFFTCPCCWQSISMILDLSVSEQQYVEDCEVCCRPLTISFSTNDQGELNMFEADPIDK